ncbi:MAG: DNA polymerase III subunit beta [Chloroflexales bacterium]|nr:DNA polymerase III subunit beta [Chloroflexales bacterium]
MKLTCLQENLKRGLSIVSHAVAGKSTLPVLSNILLATDNGRLKLAATNLELGITCWIGSKVDREGAVTIPAKLLTDLVSSLPNDRITLELDSTSQSVKLMCARYENNINGIDADEFPALPTLEEREPNAVFSCEVLREAIDQIAFAAATDDSRPVLTGVLLRLRDGYATLASADGFRLAQRVIPLTTPVNEPVELIIPARALIELARIIAGSESNVAMTITPGGGQVLFHTEDIDLVTRVIDGKYPDIERVIPQQYTTRTLVDTSELAKAIKVASLFANASASIVRLTIEPGGDTAPGRINISANAAEVGNNSSIVDGMVHGEGNKIALNVRFLQEAINAIKTAQIAIETQTEQQPAVFRPVGVDGYIHIVMPMMVR